MYNNNTTGLNKSQISDQDAELFDELTAFIRLSSEDQDKWLKDNALDDDLWTNLISIVIWQDPRLGIVSNGE